MTRLIDAEHLAWNVKGIKSGTLTVKYLLWILENQEPTIDAHPVKNGEWIGCTNAESIDNECKCSVCGYTVFDDFARNYKYCPNCGARMWKE